ncbi:MAG TPA: hypothetical protein VKV02_07325, partial [Acidobacteriaceae bacterium]|nr:hypothetical protein [Acidobacteriaceae bacterium]
AQAEGEPADTQAPEAFLRSGLETLNEVMQRLFGVLAIRPHAEHERLIRSAHRFRSTDQIGFFGLAKDLTRILVDNMDSNALQKVVPLQKGEKRGSLKSLQAVLGTVLSQEHAHHLMSPLFGIYDLRLADAHLPPADLDQAYLNVKVDRTQPFVTQGAQLIFVIVNQLHLIATALDYAKSHKTNGTSDPSIPSTAQPPR